MSPNNVIPAHQVQVVTPPPPTPAAPPTVAPSVSCANAPKISVIKDGDTVRTIEVVCRCGEVIRLECQY